MSGFGVWEVQKALYEKLSADSTLTGMGCGVFDDVPQGASFPYITIGEAETLDASVCGVLRQRLLVTLHCWSRAGGRKETLFIMGRMYDLLHRGELAPDGQSLVEMRFLNAETRLETDGATRHGIFQLLVITEES